MSRVPAALAALILGAAPLAARAQPAATPSVTPPGAPDGAVSTAPRAPAPPPPASAAPLQPVEVTELAAPDAFSTAVRDTGLPPTLWRGTSLQVVRAVLPLLADRPLSPAAAALARRVLATGAPGPEGAGQDPALVAGRAGALMAQGDPRGAAAVLARAPGLDRDPDLARVAAESALLAGQDDRACRIEAALTAGRDDIYWVRLRTYCQAVAGQTAAAQLTFDLAQSQAKDAAFARLMGAKLAGGGSPGAPSLRNGLDYALSRNLGLDLSQAKPSPAVAAALASGNPAEPAIDVSGLPAYLLPFAEAIANGKPIRPDDALAALKASTGKDPKTRERDEAALVLLAAYETWPGLALGALPVREGRAPVMRDIALDAAGLRKRMGETAMLALWTCAEAGPAGPAPADRARIVRALREAGFERDARAFTLEGLVGLR
ncbi:hypothetical protein [Phenylobacterium sp.]|uniref:hypothetical protein n=1 Tax=Phenylobacterium sp. TaxID=1871053 RepID=UPI002DE45CAE|nr:hypothetical protein [Phenylobacterium sp.]